MGQPSQKPIDEKFEPGWLPLDRLLIICYDVSIQYRLTLKSSCSANLDVLYLME